MSDSTQAATPLHIEVHSLRKDFDSLAKETTSLTEEVKEMKKELSSIKVIGVAALTWMLLSVEPVNLKTILEIVLKIL